MDRPLFITIDDIQGLASGSEPDPAALLASLYLSLTIRVGGRSLSYEREPAIDFLREYHSALIESMILGLPGTFSLYSDDVVISLEKEADSADSMNVKLAVGGASLAYSMIPAGEVVGVFRAAVSRVVSQMKTRFPYGDIVSALSTPMIPPNEAYLARFLGQDSSPEKDLPPADRPA